MISELGQKIMIIGSGGSGKSTLALRLSEVLSLPIIHLDREYWRAGWNPTPVLEWYEKVAALARSPQWIMDGNYSDTFEFRLAEADTVIFLDYNKYVCILSVIKRWLSHMGKTRADMADDCPEKVDIAFLKWVWRFSKDSRPEIIKSLAQWKDVRLIVIRSRRELKRYFY
jgi:adenylate kinase family enzyme